MMFDPGACCGCGSTSTTCVTIQWKYCIDSPTLLNRRLPAGYVVTVTQNSDGATLASQTTDANGQVSYCYPTGTAHTVTIAGGAVFGTQSFAGSGLNRTILVQPISPTYSCLNSSSDGFCSSGLLLTYRAVTITDANGSYSYDLQTDLRTPDLHHSHPAMWIPNPAGGGCVLGAGSVRYFYSILRTNAGLAVIRNWDATGTIPSSCATDRILGSQAVLANGATCPDIFASGSLTPNDDYEDPVGGTVTVST